jgi:DNA polymerase-1
MVTADKDFAQLVSDNIYIYKPGRSGGLAEIIGLAEVKEKFKVQEPGQVIDILALWGDVSDNIPGVPGIGEKTAKSLIERFGTIEGVFENIGSLKGKQRENLESSAEQARISKELATIIVDVPIEFNLDLAKRQALNRSKVEKIFDALDFKNLKSKLLGEVEVIKNSNTNGQGTLFQLNDDHNSQSASTYDSINTVDRNYVHLKTDIEIGDLFDKLKNQERVCFDTETTGLDVIDAEIVGLSFSFKSREAYYISFPGEAGERRRIINLLKELFQRKDLLVIGQNLKYDLHVLKNYDIEVKGKLFDTMVAHYLVAPDKRHGLDAMALDYLNYSKIKTEELIGKKGLHQRNFSEIDVEKVSEYACEDADITWQSYLKLNDELSEKGMVELAGNIEMPLVKVLMEMEHTGVSLNSTALDEFAVKLRDELIVIEKNIFKLAGEIFNINSPKQLGDILFGKLKILPDAKKTKSKQYSTGEEVLVNLVDRHEIVQEVLDYRSLKKLLSTYVEALPKLIHPRTNRIHTSFNQTLVATGRLSSNQPNLQNIPVREDRGREIRKAFISSDHNHRFLSADYSQIELRLMAHLSNDEQMINAFLQNEDIHTTTASKVYGVDPEDVTREMRSKAKTANFGIIYGISAFGLSQRMRIPRAEAKDLIDGYFANYPGVKDYMDQCINFAREHGFVETMFGRRRNLPEIHSRNAMIRGNAERNAINTPIQGTAADIIKIAMVSIHNAFEKNGLSSKMVIQVHDELNFDVPVSELEQVKFIVKDSMENAVKLAIPLAIEMNVGANWLEAH